MNRRYFIRSGGIALASFGVMTTAPTFLKRALAANLENVNGGRRKTQAIEFADQPAERVLVNVEPDEAISPYLQPQCVLRNRAGIGDACKRHRVAHLRMC